MSAPRHGQQSDRDEDSVVGQQTDPLADALGTLRRHRFEPPSDMVDRAVLRAVQARAAAEERERTSLRRFVKPVSVFGLLALTGVGAVVLVQRLGNTPGVTTEATPSAEPVGLEAPPRESVPVRFVLPAAGAREVAVAGEFNGWDPSRTPLNDDDGDGVFHTTLSLERGAYAYMFVVDGERWVTDPFADAYRDDGFGNRNAVLRIP